jgi:hypothetical protein
MRLLTLVLALAACDGTLYTASGLPPLAGNQCGPGQITCELAAGPTCFAEDAAHCGSRCDDCTGLPGIPARAAAACLGGACGFACQGGFLKAGGACEGTALVVAGDAHTCAVTAGGRLKCWGANGSGQATGGPSTPVLVPFDLAAAGVTAAAAGSAHTCAVVSGAVRCWGANGSGQATPPPGLTGVTALAAGAAYTCALAGGAVVCWGANGSGQATPPPGLAGATALTAGAAHACALAGDTVRCWGDPARLRLAGDGQNNVVRLAAGGDFTCAADASPTPLRCWGDNSLGQLPGMANPAMPGPPQKSGGGGGDLVSFGVSALASGRTHTCVLREGAPSEGVKCFGGDGALGQLGGTPPGAGELMGVPLTLGAVSVAAGADHACVVLGDGSLACWGANGSGQLGDGTASTPPPGTVRFVSGL